MVRKKHFFLYAFIPALLVSSLIAGAFFQSEKRMETMQMERQIEDKAYKINKVVSKLLFKTQVLSALVIQSDGEINDFERVAATVVDDPAILNLLIAPGGVCQRVYPLSGNEAVIGFDLLGEGEGNEEARQAKKTGELVMGGPFHLVQGGQAIVGRLPVMTGPEGKFWGLVSVTLNYPEVLSGADLGSLEDMGFAYELWRISPDTNKPQVIAQSSYPYSKETRYLEKEVNILNAKWYFRISPIKAWYEQARTWVVCAIALLFSVLTALLVQHTLELRVIRENLQTMAMLDPLTQALNRRGLFETAQRWIAHKRAGFYLFYLDLNNFKHINDEFGHQAGDAALTRFVSASRVLLPSHAEFARIGGDEFIVLIGKESLSLQETQELWQRLRERLSSGSGGAPPLTFSMGQASCPEDGCTVDALIRFADEAMYAAKKSEKGETEEG